MVDATRGSHHEVLRTVVVLVVLPDRVASDSFDGLRGSTNRAAECVLAKHGLAKSFVGDVFWIVVVHRQLFKDDGALVFKLDWVDERRRQHVCNHIDSYRQRCVLDSSVITGVLFACRCIRGAADLVKLDGDV